MIDEEENRPDWYASELAQTNPNVAVPELPPQNSAAAGEVVASGEDPELEEVSAVRVLTEGAVRLARDPETLSDARPAHEPDPVNPNPMRLRIAAIILLAAAAAAWMFT